ncbi:MAG: DUF1572 family protein [Terracidiphilus sp.]
MATTATELANLFLTSSRNELFNQHWPRLKACVEPLTFEQVWWRPNEASNSVGNLVLHLNGNVTQWIVNSFNRSDDRRDRPAEFSADGGLTAAELLARLDATMTEAAKVIDRLTVEQLLAPYEIQGYKTRGLDAVYHVVDHFGIHFGQIAYITKSLTATDLGFYKELNKTGRAK